MSVLKSIGIDSSVFLSNSVSLEDNGRYKVVVGAYNVNSLNGTYYIMSDTVREVYEPNSVLQQRVKGGDVKSELNHPPFLPGMDVTTYLERLMTIEESNVCNIITELKLDSTPTKIPGHADKMFLVKAIIEPYGEKANELKASLDNSNSNTAYSVRGLNYSKEMNGMLYKEIHTVNTYDFVKNPGISVAKKSEWSKLSLESVSTDLSSRDIDSILNRLDARDQIATEAESMFIKQVRDSIIGCDDNSCIYKVW